MTCPRCQTINPAGSMACTGCGTPLMNVPQAGYAMPPGQPYVVMQPMAVQRSGTPKVMGILMIVFASLGLLVGLAGLGGNDGAELREFRELEAWKNFELVTRVTGIIGLFISALHLYAGIRAVGYRRNAPALALWYAITNIVTTVLSLVLVYVWLKPALDVLPGAGAMVGTMLLVAGVISVIWPIIVLCLMTTAAAKAACTS
jgi:hypothetical protein